MEDAQFTRWVGKEKEDHALLQFIWASYRKAEDIARFLYLYNFHLQEFFHWGE